MKLPLDLVFFFLRPMKLLPLVRLLYVLSFEAAPPAQSSIVASNRQATAAHMKPKLYRPSETVRPAERKTLRPMT